MLKEIFDGLVDIAYPKRCVICSKRIDELLFGNPLCHGCFTKFQKNTPPFCLKCGHNLSQNQIYAGLCKNCHRRTFAFKRAWSACYYEGELKELIHRFKYKNRPKLAKLLAQPLLDFIKEHSLPLERFDYCIPMPLDPIRLREREFNQAELLADELSKYLSFKIMRDTLKRIKHTRPQVDLEQNQRFDNIKGAFGLENGQVIKDKTILVLDDLITTGATASEAASALLAGGAKEVYCLTLATPR